MVPAATGSGVLQRTQLRSPGGLATPHAGLLHMLGGVSGSVVLLSPWSKKPQSMQAMAPSRSLVPQDGQMVGVAPATGIAPEELGGGGGTGGRLIAGVLGGLGGPPLLAGTVGGAGAAPGRPGTVLAAAPTGCCCMAGTVNGLLHAGQRTVLPAAPSGTCIGF